MLLSYQKCATALSVHRHNNEIIIISHIKMKCKVELYSVVKGSVSPEVAQEITVRHISFIFIISGFKFIFFKIQPQ